MRARVALAASLAVLCVAGCGGGGVTGAMKSATGPRAASGDEVVRAWTREVYAGQYGQAAGLFAPGAVVQQSETIVLRNREEAEAFNLSLPCRAKVTGIVEEPGGTLLASFDLFPGRAGGCPKGGSARVRFRIVGGQIELWKQLPDAGAAPGSSV